MHSVGLGDYVRMYPTPTTVDYKEVFNSRRTLENQMENHQAKWPHRILQEHYREADEPGQVSPEFAEYLMGYPTGWTDLKDSETP